MDLLAWVNERTVAFNEVHRDLWIVDILASLVVPLPFPLGEVFFQGRGRHGVDPLDLDPPIGGKDPVNPAVLLDDRRIQVVMRREALCEENVHCLQLVLSTCLITCVVPFPTWKDLKSGQQNHLQKFTAIVVKYNSESVSTESMMYLKTMAEQFSELCSIG